MPRPKVRPEDRQRGNKACLACKASKKRCDSQLPCASCVKRGRVTSCLYSDVDRRRRQHSLIQPHQQINGALDEPLSRDALSSSNYAADSPISEPREPIFSTRPVTPDLSNEGDSNTPLNSIVPPLTPSPAAKDIAYVDETASSSFLHFLRKTLRPHVGSVSFTDDEHHQTILEADISHIDSYGPDATPVEIYSLLESYFEATSGFLDLFTADEIDTLIAGRASSEGTTFSSSVKPEDAAALDIALAIGVQVKGPIEGSTELANGYFSRARRVAFDGMLTNQSLSTVRIFLLLAFYMLGASHRNAAAMYLGVAAKAAVVLGLHHSATYKDLEATERSMRLRTWNSLRNFDILASFILGKPKSLPVVSYVTSQTEIVGEDNSQASQSAFNAIIKACSLLENVVNKLSRGNILHIPTAEDLLEQLRQWNKGLPPTLRQFTFTSSNGANLDSADRQLLVGNIHVSCVYYFIVMLITRPFLIAYLMSRLRGRAPDQLISDPEAALDMNIKNNTISKLGQVCVSSAVYLSDMCQRVRASNFTFGNLCLLKAWIFGAGLVLGFSKFAGEPRKDISDAFEGACVVLEGIALTSPQARLYHEILISFSEAVEKYHRRVSSAVRHTVQHYIDQILVLDIPRDAPNPNQHLFQSNSGDANKSMLEQFNSAPSNAYRSTYMIDGSISMDEMQTLVGIDGYEDMQHDWDDFDAQLAESFVYDVEPFEKLFYSVE